MMAKIMVVPKHFNAIMDANPEVTSLASQIVNYTSFLPTGMIIAVAACAFILFVAIIVKVRDRYA